MEPSLVRVSDVEPFMARGPGTVITYRVRHDTRARCSGWEAVKYALERASALVATPDAAGPCPCGVRVARAAGFHLR